VLADASDADHLLLVKGPGFEGLEILVHLRCGGGAGETNVHVEVGENEAVAVGRGQWALASSTVPVLR